MKKNIKNYFIKAFYLNFVNYSLFSKLNRKNIGSCYRMFLAPDRIGTSEIIYGYEIFYNILGSKNGIKILNYSIIRNHICSHNKLVKEMFGYK